MILTLPWPPTVNSYYRNGSRTGHRYMTDAAKRYRGQVVAAVMMARARKALDGRLRMTVIANPPDRRERDLDNLLKGLQDSLQHAGVYERDSQIDDLRIVRGPIVKGGQVVVTVEPAEPMPTFFEAVGDY